MTSTQALPVAEWARPKGLRVQRDSLIWDVTATLNGPRHARTTGDDDGVFALTDSFIDADTTAGWAAFVKRYGVLALCRHGIPEGQPAHLDPDPVERGWCRPWGVETLDAWAPWVRLADTILKAGDLAEGRLMPEIAPTGEAWADLWAYQAGGAEFLLNLTGIRDAKDTTVPWVQAAPSSRNLARILAASAVTRWLLDARMTLGLTWVGKGPATVTVGPVTYGEGLQPRSASVGVFGAVGVELAARLAWAERLEVCASCGRSFAPSPNQRGRGARRYCRDPKNSSNKQWPCQRAARRDAQRDRRARLKAAGE